MGLVVVVVVVAYYVSLKVGGSVRRSDRMVACLACFLIIYESKAARSCILFEWLLSSKTQLVAGDRDHKLIDRMHKRCTMREHSPFPTGISLPALISLSGSGRKLVPAVMRDRTGNNYDRLVEVANLGPKIFRR